MKIVKETPEIMVVKDSNLIFLLIGAAFMLAPIMYTLNTLYLGEDTEWLGILPILMGALLITIVTSTIATIDRTKNSILVEKKVS